MVCLIDILFNMLIDAKIFFFSIPNTQGYIPCKEYTMAVNEFSNTINSKKFSDVRNEGLAAMDIIHKQRTDIGRTKNNVCALIRVFYKESFLNTLEDIWVF